MQRTLRSKLMAGVAVLAAATMVLSACSKTEDAADDSGNNSSTSQSATDSASGNSDESTGGADASDELPASSNGSEQVVDTAESSGDTCTIEQYGLKPFDLKTVKVGFSQSEKEDNPFRIAETGSIKAQAKKLGIQLEATNAQTDLNKQINDINDLLNKGVKLLIVAPLNSDGLEPAFQAAKDKGVPIITIDRKVNMTACQDYVTFIGSNFVEQGHRAAKAMIKALDGKGKVAILLGAAGNNVTDDRTKGFVDEIKASAPDIEIVAQQTGDFARDKGQQVTEQLIQANPEIDGIYAENDEMGIGAENALEAAGKNPGKDVKLVSVDGTKNAVQLIVDGKYNAVIESNPRFGPLAFETAMKFVSGEPVGTNIVISDSEYDSSNAAQKVDNAF